MHSHKIEDIGFQIYSKAISFEEFTTLQECCIGIFYLSKYLYFIVFISHFFLGLQTRNYKCSRWQTSLHFALYAFERISNLPSKIPNSCCTKLYHFIASQKVIPSSFFLPSHFICILWSAQDQILVESYTRRKRFRIFYG